MARAQSHVVELGDDLPETPVLSSAEPVAATGGGGDELSGRRVRVEFFEQEGDLGKDGIFASLNGVAYNIPRGVIVELPVEVLEIFTRAKYRSIETLPNGGQRERDVMRFAFQVHGEVPAAA